jgi:hypothetical protein
LALLSIGRGRNISIDRVCSKAHLHSHTNKILKLYKVGRHSASALGSIIDKLNLSDKKKVLMEIYCLIINRNTALNEIGELLSTPEEYAAPSYSILKLLEIGIYVFILSFYFSCRLILKDEMKKQDQDSF